MEDIRSYNVGASDYSKHKYQSWDFWLTFVLNPFDADLCKRILRTKQTDGRKLDYQKIKHICGERIRQLTDVGIDRWPPHKDIAYEHFEEMIADYNLTEDDKLLLDLLLYNNNKPLQINSWRVAAYTEMQKICDKRILECTN